MATEKLFADVLEEYHRAKKTGAFYVSTAEASENLVRLYLKDGEIQHLCYGPAKGKECLDILDCYDLVKAIYFDGLKAPAVSTDLPKTPEIIASIRKVGKKIRMD